MLYDAMPIGTRDRSSMIVNQRQCIKASGDLVLTIGYWPSAVVSPVETKLQKNLIIDIYIKKSVPLKASANLSKFFLRSA
jgi:hypothetical protein